MRTIKFRGQNIKGEWNYGFLSYNKDVSSDYEWFISNKSGKPFAFGAIERSIGQFTGLHDKNGKEIYEGDILDSSEKIPMIFEVYFKNGGFRYGTKDRSVDISFSNLSNNWLDRILKRFHVIGNIYENPELL